MSNTEIEAGNDDSGRYGDLEVGVELKWEMVGPGGKRKLRTGVITDVTELRINLLSTQYMVKTGRGPYQINAKQVTEVLNEDA